MLTKAQVPDVATAPSEGTAIGTGTNSAVTGSTRRDNVRKNRTATNAGSVSTGTSVPPDFRNSFRTQTGETGAAALPAGNDSSTGSNGDSPIGGAVAAFALLGAVLTGTALYPKRHIQFYENDRFDSKTVPIFTVTQMKRFEFPRKRYAMEMSGGTLAVFEKNVFTNVFRRKWWIRLPGGHEFVVKEDSVILSLMRRWVPVIGGFIRTNFVFFDLRNDPEQRKPVGIFKRKIELFDNYLLDLKDDPAFTIPRQVAIGMAILLDTGEKR